MKKQMSKITRQSGVVLIVSLFMLLLLSLIGLSGMQSTALEEKMASNSRDQNLAFQSAEAALRGGENIINDSNTLLSDFDGAGGLFGSAGDISNYKLSSTWSANNSAEFDTGIASNLATTQPRYWIKYVKDEPDPDEIGISNEGGKNISYFIVTARGTGQRDTSQVVLRSNFARKF